MNLKVTQGEIAIVHIEIILGLAVQVLFTRSLS